MTAQPARWRPDLPPAAVEPERKPTLFVVASCACGAQVAEVRDRAGNTVRLDLGDGKARRDPAGDWWAVKVTGQWRVMQPQPGEDAPASGVRYLGHRCPTAVPEAVTAVLGAVPAAPVGELAWSGRQRAEHGPHAGPCAGGCGALVPRAYGPAAEPMCPECREILTAWRASPGPFRPPIPYGRVVDGVYQRRGPATGHP